MSISIPSIIAHRGAPLFAPENTLRAFQKAKALGAEMIEFDVRLTQDGIPVVSHDDSLERTAHQAALISQLNCSALQELDLGDGEQVPTFLETMQCLSALGLKANIELKPTGSNERALVDAVFSVLSPSDFSNELLISSFSMPALESVRQHSKDVALGALFTELPDNWSGIVTPLSCYSVHLKDACADAAVVSLLKKHAYHVFVYTVNDAARANQLFSWGVDGVFTDDVGKMLQSFTRTRHPSASQPRDC